MIQLITKLIGKVELSTLKNNNTRLTSALQESTSNVEEWKRQLHNYKVSTETEFGKEILGHEQN